jgi:proteasome lid subunit RPN8/RPN11
MMHISLAAQIMDQIVDHARNLYPQEACGLLIGHIPNVERFVAAANVLASETAYEMDPGFLAATLRSLRSTGEQLVAIMHSHPRGPAEPSEMDLRRAYYPEAAQIIVSLATLERPQVHAFRIIDGQAYEVELHAIL